MSNNSYKTTGHNDVGTCFLVEKTGDQRMVFGPYPSIMSATKHAGFRYAIVRGRGLENGQTLTCGAVHAKVESRIIYAVDGSDLI